MNLIEDDAKICRYMDVAKFASLLTTRCLYFACPTQFRDPYEGWLPKSHIKVWSSILQKYVDDWRALRSHFPTEWLSQFDSGLATMADRMSTVLPETAAKFGVSCWHENEGEPDATWKLYSPTRQTVAIESTVRHLESALMNQKAIVVDRVRYEDFDNARIEKGHKSYVLHIKRKCFEHEREIRATVPLPALMSRPL